MRTLEIDWKLKYREPAKKKYRAQIKIPEIFITIVVRL